MDGRTALKVSCFGLHQQSHYFYHQPSASSGPHEPDSTSPTPPRSAVKTELNYAPQELTLMLILDPQEVKPAIASSASKHGASRGHDDDGSGRRDADHTQAYEDDADERKSELSDI